MPRLSLEMVRVLGIEPGWPGRVVVPARRAVVICLDPADPPSPIEGATELVVAADRAVAVHGAPVVARIRLGKLSRAAAGIARGSPVEVVIHSLESVRLPVVVRALGLGARCVHFTHAVGASVSTPALTALALGLLGSAFAMGRRALKALGLRGVVRGWELAPPLPTRRSVRRALVLAARQRRIGTHEPGAIVHYIGDLGSGGAERQLSYLAAAQARAGHRVTVLTALPLHGNAAHYVPDLTAAGASVRSLPELRSQLASIGPRRAIAPATARSLAPELLVALESHPGRRRVIPLIEALRDAEPEVLHCWLDDPNAVGALAGQVAGVPRVVLSTRNLSPRHLPRLCRTWYRASYRLAAHGPRVRLIANSRAGAADYAAWGGFDARRFHVVYNGIDLERLPAPSREERAARRAELGLPADAFVVAGVFRLADEKRPLDFLDVLACARRRIPGLRALHVGVGPDERAVHERARALGLLDGCLTFAGRQREPARYLAAADASLLTSAAEGCPNVVLESQALGVPVVLTRAAGSPEAVLDGVTGFVCDVGDIEGLATRLGDLAADPPLAHAMGERGRPFIAHRFSIERMVAETFAAYG